MYSLDDTIVAISTPLGQGGIGIIRLSGPQAIAIAIRHFSQQDRRGWAPEPRRLYYGRIVRPDDRTTIDQVLLATMPAPFSYTRQDVAEINAHGGMLPLREILRLCLQDGARLAEPGEFTLRAFLNGRIDLAQAEAVLDVIRAQTQTSLHIAQQQMEGRLSAEVRHLRRELLHVLAYFQARADFPEDDVPERDVLPELAQAKAQLATLLNQANQGMIYRQGVRTAIVGRPNVGKSSLLNRLLGQERAIVTDIPGTTRDTLSETIDLHGIPLVLVDTAGISASRDPIETLGIERSRTAITLADLVLLLVDSSVPPTPADEVVADLVGPKQAVLVLNKSDLLPCYDYHALLPTSPHIAISALTGAGMDDLQQGIVNLLLQHNLTPSSDPIVSNPRHQQALMGAAEAVDAVCRAYQLGTFTDLLTIDLAEAIRLLGAITGESASDELLATIFSSFCIGK
ncbi:MAG: tRNA uridine-5-carboxymethylaminomethyl(34) synthesis GTPase MnmE [Anaerolineae bacterium]